MAMKHYEPGKPYHRPGQKKRKKNLRPLLALLALLAVLGLAVGLVFAWLNRHKAQVPEDVAPIVTEAPAAPTATASTVTPAAPAVCCCTSGRSCGSTARSSRTATP